MKHIKKIPVIGYILRVLWAIIKLPKHLELLYKGIDGVEDSGLKIFELQQWNSDRMRENVELQLEIAELKQWKSDRMQDIVTLQQWNKERLQEIKRLQNLDVDAAYIKKLNYLCSSLPTVWGEEERLHISKLAAVDVCFFNTNSGHITIGDYTFAGSGVSILAGSHDMKLTGLLRRDVEITEGCDIQIGSGVWLASNSVILGPTVIEDNAVIAAGAVVVPGTHVPAGTIYGGVPAKEIGRIDLSQNESTTSFAYRQAMQRVEGVLFRKGWTQKEERSYDGITYIGHVMFGKTAEISVQKKKMEFLCYLENYKECTLTIEGDNCTGYQCTLAEGKNRICVELEDGWNGKEICDIKLNKLEDEVELFVAYIGGE